MHMIMSIMYHLQSLCFWCIFKICDFITKISYVIQLISSPSKGRHQNSSVASGDFLQRMTNVGW